MNTLKRIFKNMLSLYAAQFVVSILSLVFTVFVAKYLGSEEFGRYSFALAYVSIFVIFSDLGYNTLMVREIARNKTIAQKYLSNVLTFRILISFIIFVILITVINLTNHSTNEKNIIYIFGISTLLIAISDTYRVTFRAFEKMEYEALTTILLTTIRIICGIFVLYLGYGIIGVAIAFVISAILDFMFSFFICNKKLIKPTLELDLYFLKNTIKVAIPLATISLFSLIFVKTDTIMLSFIQGDAATGLYNAAYTLILGLKSIPRLYFIVVFPLMANYFISSKKSLKLIYTKSFQYLFTIGLPITIGITILAEQIINIMYGPEYQNSIQILQILAWDALLMFLYTPLAELLVSANNEKQMNIIAGIAAVINVVLNFMLIPLYSYIGASIATIISEVVLFALYFYIINRKYYKFNFTLLIKPTIASFVMGITTYLFKEISLVILVPMMIVYYFLILYVIGGVSNSEKEMIKMLTKKGNDLNHQF